jgi:hypothetical protein
MACGAIDFDKVALPEILDTSGVQGKHLPYVPGLFWENVRAARQWPRRLLPPQYTPLGGGPPAPFPRPCRKGPTRATTTSRSSMRKTSCRFADRRAGGAPIRCEPALRDQEAGPQGTILSARPQLGMDHRDGLAERRTPPASQPCRDLRAYGRGPPAVSRGRALLHTCRIPASAGMTKSAASHPSRFITTSELPGPVGLFRTSNGSRSGSGHCLYILHLEPKEPPLVIKT